MTETPANPIADAVAPGYQFEGAALDPPQHQSDFLGDDVIHVPDEAQRQVIIFRRDPACAGQSATTAAGAASPGSVEDADAEERFELVVPGGVDQDADQLDKIATLLKSGAE